MLSMQTKVCLFFIEINQNLKSKLKQNKNKENQNKQPTQFIYVQDNQEK